MDLPHSLEIWDNAARAAIPIWLKAWLALLGLTFASALFFVRTRVPARAAIAGFAASHLLLIGIELGDLAVVRTGLVSLLHTVCWAPVLPFLIRALPGSASRSAYGVWLRMLLFIIVVALVFDVRDATMYLYYQLAGHPALEVAAG